MYKRDEWLSTDKQEIDTPENFWIKLNASGPETVSVSGVNADGEIVPLKHGQHFKWIRKLTGYSKLIIQSKKPFGMDFELAAIRDHDPINLDPAYERPIPRSPLGLARERIRAELGLMRETFENETLFPGYEMDDEEDDVFEEDLLERDTENRTDDSVRTPVSNPLPKNPPQGPQTAQGSEKEVQDVPT